MILTIIIVTLAVFSCYFLAQPFRPFPIGYIVIHHINHNIAIIHGNHSAIHHWFTTVATFLVAILLSTDSSCEEL